MLIGSFAFSNNSKDIESKKIKENSFETISTQEKLVYQKLVVNCLIKFTFVTEDGKQTVRYLLVENISCGNFKQNKDELYS
jgi:hypothetical protein